MMYLSTVRQEVPKRPLPFVVAFAMTTLVLQTAMGNVSYGLKKKNVGGEIARVTDACRYDVIARYWASQKLLSMASGRHAGHFEIGTALSVGH